MLVLGAHTAPPALLLHNFSKVGRGGGCKEGRRRRKNFKGRMSERTGNERKWRWKRRQPRNGARTHQVVCKAERLQLRKGSYGVGWR